MFSSGLFWSWMLSATWAQEDSSDSSTNDDTDSTTDTLPRHDSSDENSKEEKSNNAVKVDAEIIVYGENEVHRRRQLLDKQLTNRGYRPGKVRGDKTIYHPDIVWKPTVVVHESGWVELRKTPPRFEPFVGNPDNKWNYLYCLPSAGLMCVRAGGWLISKRRAQHSKTDVIDDNIAAINYWQESVIGIAHQNRIEVALPNELDAIWSNPSEEAKLQIMTLWSTRTCTPEGKQAAQVILDFLLYEVDDLYPISPTDHTWFENNNPCNFPIE